MLTNYDLFKKEAIKIEQAIDKKASEVHTENSYCFGLPRLHVKITWYNPEMTAYVIEPEKQYTIVYNWDTREKFSDYESFISRLLELHSNPELHEDKPEEGFE